MKLSENKMNMIKNKYVQVLGAFLIYSFAGVMAKLAAMSGGIWFFLGFLGAEFLLLAVYALIWQQVLKKLSLTVAMSCKGIVVILSLVWAVLFFGETVNLNHILGSLIIVFGIIIVSGGKEAKNDE